MKQEEAFLKGEGDAWYQRNKDQLNTRDDPVLGMIAKNRIIPHMVLEIGCANGWRLQQIQDKYGSHCWGVDPSREAIISTAPSHYFSVGTAAKNVHWDDEDDFDLIIFGFCLYLCDREDLFKIVMQADRALNNGGYLIIQDFYTPNPHSVVYEHQPELQSYHMDYPSLWLANPTYQVVRRTIVDDDAVEVAILQKAPSLAWPLK